MRTRPLLKGLAIGLGASLALSISLSNVFWIGAGLLWVFLKLKNPGAWPWKTTGLEGPALAFGLWSLLMSDWNAPLCAIFHNYKSQTLLLVFFVVSQVFDEKNNRALLMAFLIASVVSALWGCLQKSTGLNWDPTTMHRDISRVFSFTEKWPQKPFRYISLRDGRAIGTRSHPLTYAECLLPPFFIFLALAFERGRLFSHWKPLGAAGLLGLAIVWSQSRGVWLGGAAGLGYLLIRHRSSKAWALTTLALALAAVLLGSTPEARHRLLSIFEQTTGQDQSSKNIRFELWNASWKALGVHPLTGVGTGNLRILISDEGHGPRLWTEAHNIYLQQAAEKGWMGLVLFLWLLSALWKKFQSASPPWRNGFLAGFVGLLVCGLTESWLNDSTVVMVVMALAASARSFSPAQETSVLHP